MQEFARFFTILHLFASEFFAISYKFLKFLSKTLQCSARINKILSSTHPSQEVLSCRGVPYAIHRHIPRNCVFSAERSVGCEFEHFFRYEKSAGNTCQPCYACHAMQGLSLALLLYYQVFCKDHSKSDFNVLVQYCKFVGTPASSTGAPLIL